MSLLARLGTDGTFFSLSGRDWRGAVERVRAALMARWARLPAPQRILELVAITIVLVAAVLFVWVLWTQPANRR